MATKTNQMKEVEIKDLKPGFNYLVKEIGTRSILLTDVIGKLVKIDEINQYGTLHYRGQFKISRYDFKTVSPIYPPAYELSDMDIKLLKVKQIK